MCFTIIHTISGNLQNNDYQKKESVRDEWTLSAIGYFVLSPVARSCLVAMNLLKLTSEVVRVGDFLLIRINHLLPVVLGFYIEKLSKEQGEYPLISPYEY